LRVVGSGSLRRLARHALGHNSKAVHHAYTKHAEVTVPSLDDWEKDWQENPQSGPATKIAAGAFLAAASCQHAIKLTIQILEHFMFEHRPIQKSVSGIYINFSFAVSAETI
jgi:hypothetical protein